MIIESEAPTRISLFGGGSDVPSYSDKYGGLVVNMAINLRQRITIFTEEDVFRQFKNEFPGHANPEFYYQIFKAMDLDGGHRIKIKSTFDGIIESGLGSSAAAAVALIGALSVAKGEKRTKSEIAEKAWDMEVNKIGLYGGRQDQYASAYGGVNVMEFNGQGEVHRQLPNFMDEILPGLVLFYTGSNRKSPHIQEGLKELTPQNKEALDKIKDLARRSLELIQMGDIPRVGALLDESWKMKKKSNNVTTPEIDEIYSRAEKLGAYGGKICGSGGGGYMLFIVDPAQRENFIRDMKLEWVDFSVEQNGLMVRRIK